MNSLGAADLLVLASAPSFAGELIGIGVRAGIPLTDAFDAVKSEEFSFESATKRFTIGPSAELFLPFGLGIEADVLYKKTDMEITRGGAGGEGEGPLTLTQSTGVWEIPLMAKYRFPGVGLRPFLGAGGSFRSFGDLPAISTNLNDSGWGFVIGAGLEIKVKRLRISPEIRFTRWGSGENSTGESVLKFNRNQADFLVGFTF